MINLPLLMEELARLGMINIIIEGGSTVNAYALRSGMVDKVLFFLAPKILGGDDSRGSVGGRSPEALDQAVRLYDIHYTKLGEDLLIEGYTKEQGGNKADAPEAAPEAQNAEEKKAHRKRRRKRRR